MAPPVGQWGAFVAWKMPSMASTCSLLATKIGAARTRAPNLRFILRESDCDIVCHNFIPPESKCDTSCYNWIPWESDYDIQCYNLIPLESDCDIRC